MGTTGAARARLTNVTSLEQLSLAEFSSDWARLNVYENDHKNVLGFWFLTEEIQYHDGLRSRELGQAPILLCAPNS